jgi:hypothetical protein
MGPLLLQPVRRSDDIVNVNNARNTNNHDFLITFYSPVLSGRKLLCSHACLAITGKFSFYSECAEITGQGSAAYMWMDFFSILSA